MRTPKHSGNGEGSIGSVKACSSILLEEKMRKRKERKEKKEKNVNNKKTDISSADSTSSLTLDNSVNMEAIKLKMSVDKEFRKIIIQYSKEQESSEKSRGMGE